MPIPFFQFPGEIRNKIYAELLVLPANEHIMIQGTLIDLDYLKHEVKNHKFPRGNYNFSIDLDIPRPRRVVPPSPSPSPSFTPLHPLILLASHLTHSEALPFLYSLNTFVFGANIASHEPLLRHSIEESYLLSFLHQIRRRNASLLRHLRLNFPAWTVEVAGNTATSWLHDTTHFYQTVRSATPKSVSATRGTWALLENMCAGLVSVKVTLEGRMTEEAVDAARGYFERFPSLRRVKVCMYRTEEEGDEGAASAVVEKMRGLGWEIEWLEGDTERLAIAYWSMLDLAPGSGALQIRRRDNLAS